MVALTHMLGRFLDDFGNVVRYLADDGYHVIVYASVPKDSQAFSTDSSDYLARYTENLPTGVEIRPLPYLRDSRTTPLQVLRLMGLGFRLGRRHPDAMFMTWSVFLIVVCGLPLRLLNRRNLFMVTGLGPVLGSKGKQFRVFRVLIRAVYAFLMSGRNSRCLNHNAEDKVYLAKALHADPDKFFVTPGCGVDPSVFPFLEQPAGNPVPVVVVPARLIEPKGIREAVAASGLLRDRGVAHEMRFTGAVEPYPWISLSQEEIDGYQARNPHVKFVGFQPSMPEVYAQADVVCYPTRYPEGTPTALIEAAASGRVAVTCDTVGAREIVVNESTGLVAPRLDIPALADALQRVIEDVELRDRFRDAAFVHFMNHYTKDMALVATLAAFESVGMEFNLPKSAPDIRIAHGSSAN
jgi:glycosyltransferase involved in cell wall biosynthesis